MKFRGMLTGSLLALALVLAACGGNEPNSSGQGNAEAGETFTVEAGPGAEFKYNTTTISAKPNANFKIKLKNTGSVQHNLVIQGPNNAEVVVGGATKTEYLNPGAEVESAAIAFPAGAYKFYCSFPGHESLMTGQIVVQ